MKGIIRLGNNSYLLNQEKKQVIGALIISSRRVICIKHLAEEFAFAFCNSEFTPKDFAKILRLWGLKLQTDQREVGPDFLMISRPWSIFNCVVLIFRKKGFSDFF